MTSIKLLVTIGIVRNVWQNYFDAAVYNVEVLERWLSAEFRRSVLLVIVSCVRLAAARSWLDNWL